MDESVRDRNTMLRLCVTSQLFLELPQRIINVPGVGVTGALSGTTLKRTRWEGGGSKAE